ncbi:hypothetical protein B0H14DRAFT_3127126 [Mycena olivaceomarginata]|nr:hypothetical protein B0H14DRAFT_3127126 [Mycena olivaceomarginata]
MTTSSPGTARMRLSAAFKRSLPTRSTTERSGHMPVESVHRETTMSANAPWSSASEKFAHASNPRLRQRRSGAPAAAYIEHEGGETLRDLQNGDDLVRGGGTLCEGQLKEPGCAARAVQKGESIMYGADDWEVKVAFDKLCRTSEVAEMHLGIGVERFVARQLRAWQDEVLDGLSATRRKHDSTQWQGIGEEAFFEKGKGEPAESREGGEREPTAIELEVERALCDISLARKASKCIRADSVRESSMSSRLSWRGDALANTVIDVHKDGSNIARARQCEQTWLKTQGRPRMQRRPIDGTRSLDETIVKEEPDLSGGVSKHGRPKDELSPLRIRGGSHGWWTKGGGMIADQRRSKQDHTTTNELQVARLANLKVVGRVNRVLHLGNIWDES